MNTPIDLSSPSGIALNCWPHRTADVPDGHTVRVYKLTRADGSSGSSTPTTFYGPPRHQWPLPDGDRSGEWCESLGDPSEGLCSPGFLHWYAHPNLAALTHSSHVSFGPDMLLWEAEAAGVMTLSGSKGGSTRLRLVRRVDLPEYSRERVVAFALMHEIALENYYSRMGRTDMSASTKERIAWCTAWLKNPAEAPAYPPRKVLEPLKTYPFFLPRDHESEVRERVAGRANASPLSPWELIDLSKAALEWAPETERTDG